jgi:hypothetical protein
LRNEADGFADMRHRVTSERRRHGDSLDGGAAQRCYEQSLLLALHVVQRLAPRVATGERQVFALLAKQP